VAAVVVPFFASTYAAHRFEVPLGWDTPKYMWKTELASSLGVTGVPDRLPPPVNGSPDRPAFPVVALVADRVLGLEPIQVAEALPIAMAAAIGLACAGLASAGFGLGRWGSAIVGASVGASVCVARMAGPETYQDNLMVAAVLVAVAVLAVAGVAAGRGLVAPALLMGAAAIVHWSFALLFAGILVVAAGLLGPRSWRSWRNGQPALRTPGGGLLAVAAGGAAAGLAGLYGAIGAGLKTPKTSPQARFEYDKKLRHDLSVYAPWLTLPGAAIGAWGLWRRSPGDAVTTGRARVAGAVLAAWVGVTVLAAVLSRAGATVPAHRFLAFALPVPFLVAAAAVTLPAVLGRRWSVAGRVAGVVVGIGLLAGSAIAAQAFWFDVQPQTNSLLLRQVDGAARYLDAEGVPDTTPVVFIANARGDHPGVNIALFAHEIRSALPAERIEHAYMYLGDPESYLAGRPTIVRPVTADVREYDGTSWRYFRDVRPLLRHGPTPVALLLPEANPDRTFFARWAADHRPGPPGTWVVAGPAYQRPAPTGQPEPLAAGSGAIGGASVGWAAVALLALVCVVGSGWAVAAAPAGWWFVAAALAPAVGVAVTVTGGVVADRAGVALTSSGGLALAIVLAALGWAVAGLRLAGRRSGARAGDRTDDARVASPETT
jgi:hypothetical protein